VFDGYIDASDVFSMCFSDAEYSAYKLQPGDVLLNEGQSLALVGRAAMYTGHPADCCFQNSLIRFRPGSRIDPTFATELFRYFQKTGRFAAIATKTTSIAHLGVERLANVKIPLPPLSVQADVSETLMLCDRFLSALSQLAGAKQALSAALIQRFMIIDVPSRAVHLKSVAQESRVTNTDMKIADVMGVSKSDGIVPMKEQSVGGNLMRYKVLPPGAFAYNPMRINIGSIARWRGISPVLVSPDYVVFQTDASRLDSRYLDFYRRSQPWRSFVENAGNGSVRVRIYFRDLGGMKLRLPPIKRQQRIVDCLELLDSDISTLRRYASAVESLKRAVLISVLAE
jgi:type I restriction enzyme S subunit